VGDHVGANPVDRGKPGSKLHLVCDGRGLPLTVAVTAANVDDSTMFEALLEDVPAVRTPSGQRRCRPGAVHADKGYDTRHCRAYLRQRGIKARIARRGDRIVAAARPLPLAGRADAVLVGLLQAPAGPLGAGPAGSVRSCCWPVALICGNRLWSPSTSEGWLSWWGATTAEDGSGLGARGAGGARWLV
jgi:hypothetical protein